MLAARLLVCLLGALLLLQVEGIGIDEESLAYLGEIGERTSLRHAVQVRLLAASCLTCSFGSVACHQLTPCGPREQPDSAWHTGTCVQVDGDGGAPCCCQLADTRCRAAPVVLRCAAAADTLLHAVEDQRA